MENETLLAQIDGLRLNVDTCINSCKYLKPSREISLTFTNLQRCKMWLGKMKAVLGANTPYVNSENATNKTIEPQAEHTEDSFREKWADFNSQTLRVKDFRAILSDGVDSFKKIFDQVARTKNEHNYLYMAMYAMEEAKMWLGWELNRILEMQRGAVADNAAEEVAKLEW